MPKLLKTTLLLLICLTHFVMGENQTPFVTLPRQLEDDSYADWIAPNQIGPGLYYFRKIIELDKIPDKFLIHISGDTRYKFYVNGEEVVFGPAVGDAMNWHYETVDIAPFLRKGKNLLSAKVWNNGKLNGVRQISLQTAFILQGDSKPEHIANTDNSWKVRHDKGYYPIPMSGKTVGGGYIAGGTDSVITALRPKDWNTQEYDDTLWKKVKIIGKGNHLGLDTWLGTPWQLKPRPIPLLEQKKEPMPQVLQVKGLNADRLKNLKIPPDSHVEILLDNKVLTMGYPQLLIEQGAGSKIKIQYQEALFGDNGKKGNRNEWRGKKMKGYYDIFLPDGNTQQLEPLWIRVFRYVKITIDTQTEPLLVKDFYNIFTAYPLEEKAYFKSDNKKLEAIWDASWRTARLCALENYMDCPYYEQLQYVGDTRIQALISIMVAGDDRLARNAIHQLYNSMQPKGLTKSNHPSNGNQIIPPFSLIYIAMVHDYYMYRGDPELIKPLLPGIKFILEWFVSKIDENGMLGPLPYWNHIDGGTDFSAGSPPGISEGGSAHMTILLAYTLEKSVHLLRDFGDDCNATQLQNLVEPLKTATMKLCYNEGKGLLAETPNQTVYSQHTNIFAVLTDMFDEKQEKAVMQKVITDKSLIQTTLYFKFYLFQAMKKVGFGGQIIDQMSAWQSFLDMGLSTFPEHGIESRSDCHAWSAHPMFDFLNVIAGVSPGSEGFKTIVIEPQLGDLKEVESGFPHPMGFVTINYKKTFGGKLKCEITLPEGLTGKLIYKGKDYSLEPGKNEMSVR